MEIKITILSSSQVWQVVCCVFGNSKIVFMTVTVQDKLIKKVQTFKWGHCFFFFLATCYFWSTLSGSGNTMFHFCTDLSLSCLQLQPHMFEPEPEEEPDIEEPGAHTKLFSGGQRYSFCHNCILHHCAGSESERSCIFIRFHSSSTLKTLMF